MLTIRGELLTVLALAALLIGTIGVIRVRIRREFQTAVTTLRHEVEACERTKG